MIELTDFTTPDDLPADLFETGGIGATRIGWLREMVDAGRTGIHVRDRIHHLLASLNIAHWPAELPNDQDHPVLLYRTDLPAGAALGASFLLADHEMSARALAGAV